MISQHKAQEIINEPSLNNITFKEWEELPLGVNATQSFVMGCNGFCSTEALFTYLAEEFQKYKDYVRVTHYDS